jgi:MFS family permease
MAVEIRIFEERRLFMGHINWGRVTLGGLLAGIVINAFEFVLNDIVLRDDWVAALRALGKPEQAGSGEIAAFVLWGFLVGIFAIWLYAELRQHYGGRPMTAVIAGLALWFLGYLLANVAPLVLNLFPVRLMLIGLGVGLVEAIAATMVGAWLYQSVLARGQSAAPANL